jgi:large subunit ribosomal protein L17
MVTSLFRYERIKTTKTKALAIRRSAERLITRAKTDSVHNRRIVSSRLFDEGIVAKLFTNIAQRMKDRPGGYTRIIKLGERLGDASEIVILELVDYVLKTDEDQAKKAKKAAKEDKKAAKKEDKKTSRDQAGKGGAKNSGAKGAKAPAKPKAEKAEAGKVRTEKAGAGKAESGTIEADKSETGQ